MSSVIGPNSHQRSYRRSIQRTTLTTVCGCLLQVNDPPALKQLQ